MNRARLIVSCYIIIVLFIFPTVSHGDVASVIVVIEGITGEERDNVQTALDVPPDLIKEGVVDQAWLERFERRVPEKVRAALQPFGYYNAEIKTRLERVGGDSFRLGVGVTPGDPVRLGSSRVEAQGAGSDQAEIKELIASFPLRQGDVLRHDRYEEAKANLQKQAVSLGYLDAAYSEHAIRVSLDKLSASLDLVLETGPRYRFGPISFSGKPDYPEPFLMRYVEFKPGEVYSEEKIAKTQYNYSSADRFKTVTITGLKDAAVNNAVPIQISLTPSSKRKVRFGVGYGTDTRFRGLARYQDVNIAGRGHMFDAELKVSELFQGLGARYVVPSKVDVKSFSSLKAGFESEDTSEKLVKYALIEGEYTRTLADRTLGSLFVRLQQEDSKAGDQRTRSFLLLPGARLSGYRYDNVIRPQKGFRYDLEVRGTDKMIGSDTGFFQFLGSGELILPLPWRLSLITRGRIGATTDQDAAEDLPISVRFFAGGDNSVRGYKYQSLGPQDSTGKVVGGRHLVSGTLEIERAIAKDWGIAAFYDTGNAFNNWSNIDSVQGVGIGGRYYSVIGPLRLDVARQVGVRKPGYRVHFTVGIGL